MRLPKPLCAAAASLMILAACEARIGNDAPPVDENASAAGRAEEGRLSIEAPGFNMSIDIPEAVHSRARVDEDSGLIYPGSAFSGMHIQGRREGAGNEGEVEMRFTHADPPERIAAWYRDPARRDNLTVATAERRGEDFVFAGIWRPANERFMVTIAPSAGGGSETRLVVSDSER